MRPAPEDVRAEILGKLALRYPASGRSSDEEQVMRMNLLIDDLAHVPADILDTACRAVALASKFMPTAAEIMEHARPLIAERNCRGYRLTMLAVKARETPDPVQLTPEEQAAVQADLDALLARMKRSRPADEPPPRDASPEEHRAWRQTRPAVDWAKEEQRNLDALNFLREGRGEPPLSLDEYRAEMTAKHRFQADDLDADVAAVFDGKE